MVQKWLADHMAQTITGEELSISGITAYQPFDGLKELKIVRISRSLLGFLVLLLLHRLNQSASCVTFRTCNNYLS